MNSPVIKYLLANHFLTAIIVIALVWLAIELNGILIIFFISFIIMAALSPFSDFLIRKRIPNTLSVIITYLIAIAVLVLIIFPLIPFFASQIQLLFNNFPKYINEVAKIFNQQVDVSSIRNVVESDLNSLGKNILSVTGKIFSGVFSTFTVFVISFYLTLQREKLRKQLVALWPEKSREHTLKTIALIENKIGWWLRGQLLLSFTIGLFVWIGLTLLGLPFALPLGVLAGLLEIVPTIGPIVAATPAVIVALSISPGLALTIVIFYILLQMLENQLLVPKIMQQAVGLNPIIVIIGVLTGSKFLGVAGALLAVPFMATVYIIIKSFKNPVKV
jgi:predicted PurR-regulated permease PerM